MAPILLIAVVIAPAQQAAGVACPDLIAAPGDPVPAATSALGGISGTGVTRADLLTVRRGRPSVLASGQYASTAYGPPWGGIQGAGIATGGGLRLNGGAPRKYLVAVDPALIPLGSWLYLWPNPFRWRGAFLAADTGAAIVGRRVDFYDWRGRASQTAWGRVAVAVSSSPLPAADNAPLLTAVSASGADTACADSGVEIGGSGPGRDAIRLAVTYLGKNARTTPFAGFRPATTSLAWCAWFVTNLWHRAGVPIAVNWYSGYPYAWALTSHPQLVLKAAGRPASTLRLSVGTALMYGSGPNDSDHINLVRGVNPDGTVQLIGGNQDDSHVTTYGPCRLINGAYVHLIGPGCDARPIYGIVAPGAADGAAAA